MKRKSSKATSKNVDPDSPPPKKSKKKSTRKSSSAAAAASTTVTPKRNAKRSTKKNGSSAVAPVATPTPVQSPLPTSGATPTTIFPQPTSIGTTSLSMVAQAKPKEKELEYPEDVISNMMFTFGDVRKPLPESCKLVEQFVRQYLGDLTAEVTVERMTRDGIPIPIVSTPVTAPPPVVEQPITTKSKRKDKNPPPIQPIAPVMQSGPVITLEVQDLLFLFRNDPERLHKLERVLRRSEKINFDVKTEGTDAKKRRRNGNASSMDDFAAARKRLRKLDNILELLGDEKLNGFQIVEEPSPEEKSCREAMAQLAKLLPTEDYAEFCKCREINFVTHGNTKKFTTWLNLPRHYNVNDDRINEVLAHLAWELVGLVTQTSLIVKRDMQMVAVMNSIKQQQSGMDYFTLASFYNTTGLMNTELEKLMGKVSGVMDDKIRRQLSANPDVYFMHIGEPIASSGLQLKPLTSVHVLEAIRRVSQLYKY